MTSDYSNVVSMTFSVAIEDSPPLGSALNPIVIDSDEFESDQMEDFQLDGHGVFEVDEAVPSQYLRAAFSVATEEQIDVAFQRLRILIDEEIQAQS